MVVASDTMQVLQVSANLVEFLGVTPAAALGKTLVELVGEGNAQKIRDLPVRGDLQPSVPAFFSFGAGEGMSSLAAHVHRVDGDWVIEIEPREESEQEYFGQLFASTRNALWELDVETDFARYCDLIAEQVRELIGFDRVLIYRFDPDWNGEVIAESRSDRLPSLAHNHFPASDIPPQARRLYARNLIRVLADVDATPVAVVPPVHPLSGKALDMSLAVSRSMSPVHIEYLRNMEAYASASISLIQNGELWGLIACHHAEPRRLPFHVRELAEFVGKTMSMKLASLEASERSEYMNQVQETLVNLTRRIRQSDDIATALADPDSDVLRLTRATGGIVSVAGDRYTFGNVPPVDDVDSLLVWLEGNCSGEVYHTDCLESSYPPATVFRDCAAGLLAVRLNPQFTEFVLWFREQRVQAIQWAGNPEKSLRTGPEGPYIAPRRSFALWVQEQSGHSLPWTSIETDAAHALSLTLVEVLTRNAMTSKIKRTESRLKFLASHDPLTRLPNRLLLNEKLEHALDSAATSGQKLAVAFVDIDHFKVINDTMGHLAGDRYLMEIAHRLRTSLRHADILARWGGDEFVFVIEGLRGRESLHNTIIRLQAELTLPMQLVGNDLMPSASIGIAVYPDDGPDIDSLVHAADAAMYRAKGKGRNRYEFASG